MSSLLPKPNSEYKKATKTLWFRKPACKKNVGEINTKTQITSSNGIDKLFLFKFDFNFDKKWIVVKF